MNFPIGIAVSRLIIGEAKSIKQIISNNNIFKVLVELNVAKLIVKPITPKNAKSWSMLPKSNNVNSNQRKNGSPIILPIRIIKREEAIEMSLAILYFFTCKLPHYSATII